MEEYNQEYYPYDSPVDSDNGTSPSGDGSTNTGGIDTNGNTSGSSGSSGTSTTTSGNTGGVGGSIINAAQSFLQRIMGQNMTAPKPKEDEPKPPTPVAAPVAPNANAPKIKPWMWYVGGGIVGVTLVGLIIWLKKK